MAHKTVVRNKAYQACSFNIRERHNERKNQTYHNSDIEPERAHLNVHFKQNFNPEGQTETYEETFNRLLAEKKIVKHGTKPDAKIFCEMVFDVNTTYFEENGSHEYAIEFFEEAYRLAVKEAGSEDYIISAVMHADERNKDISEQLGRDVYHYHLHVVYVPIVEKKLYFKKSNKNLELAGKLKGVIPQISQSNKWPMRMQGQRDGKTVTLNSYSFLQDRYFEHMKAAGFKDFERGERGSTAEHLEVLDFKIKKDTARAEAMAAVVDEKEQAVATLDKKVEKKQERLSDLTEKITVTKESANAFAKIEKLAKKTIGGNYQFTPDDWKTLQGLAKEGVKSRSIIADLKEKVTTHLLEITGLKTKLTKYESKGITDTMRYYQAKQRAPRRLEEFLADIMRQPPEKAEQHVQKKSKEEVR